MNCLFIGFIYKGIMNSGRVSVYLTIGSVRVTIDEDTTVGRELLKWWGYKMCTGNVFLAIGKGMYK